MNLKKNFLIVCIIFFSLTSYSYSKNIDEIFIGNNNAKVKVKFYGSYTCPHCANFHNTIYPQLFSNFIKKNLIKFSFIDFPLDGAAFNASKIARCSTKETSILLLEEFYKKQKEWTEGKDIEDINKNLFLIGKKFGLTDEQMQICLKDKEIENKILNDRMNGQNKYGIDATPTIIINEKKYDGDLKYDGLSKEILKLLK